MSSIRLKHFPNLEPAEIRHVWTTSRAHGLLMVYTAVMVPATDFLTGVLSALVICLVLRSRFGALPAAVPAVARA